MIIIKTNNIKILQINECVLGYQLYFLNTLSVQQPIQNITKKKKSALKKQKKPKNKTLI